ncbi:MAG TPA: DegT/DnrJ/EryC1/StrS family aminotransferase [Gemmataceae bacterium]|nr:DegT/DnrJ/EryC1/StrS family aminotransferase [Gemmataceae bacterium]
MNQSAPLLKVTPIDLGANYRAHKEEIDRAIHRVLDKGWYILGQEVSAFEEEFARYIGASNGIAVGNGTDAIHVALRAGGISAGDKVITVSHTADATVAAVELASASPMLVDINPETYTMDPQRLEDTLKAIDQAPRTTNNPRPKAVIVVHLYGCPAAMPAIMEISRRYELFVIEDCAQAHGASLGGKKAGTWGNIAAFSFYPTKNLGAFGDGGAVVTDDSKLAEQARLVREYGWKERYISQIAGMNSRLDELQAAILRVKLKFLDTENARRREIADTYDKQRAGNGRVKPPIRVAETEHVFHQYVVRSEERDRFKEYLKDRGIGTLIHYPLPVHLQPAYRGRLQLGAGGLTHTEQACREILSLPMYPQLSGEQAHYVGDQVAAWGNLGAG